MHHARINRRPGAIFLLLAPVSAAILFAACGTDFVEPGPVATRSNTPVSQPTVFRVIAVTPVATPSPIPTAVGPDGGVQRQFPPEIHPARAALPADDVLGSWTEYLVDSRLIVEGRPIDVHVCSDGSLVPGSPSTIVSAGTWGLRPASGEWYEVILGREFRAGRISGFVTLSRIGEATVALNDGIAVVSVTDSDLCGQVGG